jgi:DNA-directed RNA polymerase specialized sigma24 family protein
MYRGRESALDASAPRFVARLADPALNARLSHFVRARVPESDADDILQATLADALAAPEPPEDDEDLARWVFGICRHKIVDWFRRGRREVPVDLTGDEYALPAATLPASAIDLAHWARRELPKGRHNEQTFEWMLREGEGEKLEAIAADANLPAPAVRQRVWRLRRYFQKRWAAQAAAVAALLIVALVVFFALRRKPEPIAPRPDPSFEPSPNLPAPIAPPLTPSPLPALSAEPDASPIRKEAPVKTPAPVQRKRTAVPRPHATVAPPKPASKKGPPVNSTFDSTPPMAAPAASFDRIPPSK